MALRKFRFFRVNVLLWTGVGLIATAMVASKVVTFAAPPNSQSANRSPVDAPGYPKKFGGEEFRLSDDTSRGPAQSPASPLPTAPSNHPTVTPASHPIAITDVVPFEGPSLMQQTPEEAMAKSHGCVKCHKGIERMHQSPTVNLGCVDCHGGDPDADTKECAHVQPRFPEIWKTSANPQTVNSIMNVESPEFIRFINPGDWRNAHLSCGTAGCHTQEVHVNRKSTMGYSPMVPGSGTYNNGILPNKIYRYGEVIGWGGVPQRIFSTPQPTVEEVHTKGILPWIDPLPDFRVSQPGNIFRVLEINNNATSQRGPGTDARVDAGFIVLHKTKLNDPTMCYLGANNNPGDYRSSGCTSCHVLYANDRNPDHSAHIAVYGNHGYSATGDPTIPRNEAGHPIKHQFTRRIPSSQCMTCHYHQGSGALGNYYGYRWWDYESGAEETYSRFGLPEPGGLVGPKSNEPLHEHAPEVNPQLNGVQFADWHNNSWLYTAVYKRNKQGELLDEDDNVVDETDPNWHKKVVHKSDIHLQKGMHCIDCHFEQDNHGDGRLYGEMINGVEIACRDCHGTPRTRANLITSNHPGGNDLRKGVTPFNQPRFYEKDGSIYQRSNVTPGLEWEVVQVKDVITPGHPRYSREAHYAKTIQRDGVTWGEVETDPVDCKRAHTGETMTCYSCHSSWNTTCAGCHLDAKENVREKIIHYEGGYSKVYVAYNPQTNREDGFMLGINGYVKGNRVSPVRSATGVVVSAQAGNRQTVVHEGNTISAEGYGGQAFTPNPPHTVGGKGLTRMCTDCHVSEKNDNNDVMAGVLGIGKKSADFIGRYLWVAEEKKGIEAVRVTIGENFPRPVIGSNMQRITDPVGYRRHFEQQGGMLGEAYGHNSRNAQSIVKINEWVLVADGPGGLQAFDIANIHNKDVAQRIVTSLISPLGQKQWVKTRNATSVAVSAPIPLDPDRTHRPENREQPLHPKLRYAFVSDYEEGLILVDIVSLFDGNPGNNFLRRAVTFNPGGILNTAVQVKVWGNYAYVLTCDHGLVVVNIDDPCNPHVVATLGEPHLSRPTEMDFTFRYAFICDAEGLKVVDITFPWRPELTTVVPMRDARGVVTMRGYAYVAAGVDGVAVVNAENPEQPGEVMYYTAGGCINDATSAVVGTLYGSAFLYVADGNNGVRVIQILSAGYGSEVNGVNPVPNPRLIATYQTKGRAVALSPGVPRDMGGDIDGNQINVYGRLGSRPFNYEEIKRMYIRDGRLYTVPEKAPPGPPTAAEAIPAQEASYRR